MDEQVFKYNINTPDKLLMLSYMFYMELWGDKK